MLTSDFPHYRLPFETFNKVQSAAIPYADKNVNLVVSAPTATGKTAIAECILAYHLKDDKQAKVIYTSPYRSLSQEKNDAWVANPQLCTHGVVISTGDHFATREDFSAGRLLILTTESFDSKTRKDNHNDWLKKVVCLCIDEAHLIGQKGRGDAVEVGLMRFTEINPDARIVLLSATLSNVDDISAWLKSLNGKETIKVKSNWRPARIETRLHTFCEEPWNSQIAMAVELAKQTESGEKTIVFVHSKKMGREISKMIRATGRDSAFHNASVPKDKRRKIEEAFDNPDSGLDILISTSTLSAGVNIG